MNSPKKLSISRKTLVPVNAKQSGVDEAKPVEGASLPEIKTTSICPFICW